jgi:hypothetical protein
LTLLLIFYFQARKTITLFLNLVLVGRLGFQKIILGLKKDISQYVTNSRAD